MKKRKNWINTKQNKTDEKYMPLFIENIKHSHNSANFIAGASYISSKAQAEFVAIGLHSVLYTLDGQPLTQNCLYIASYPYFSLW